jgi:ribonuclease BN (tRNA processing enzyme)
MRVTVLGKSPSYTDAGGACSGYLVEEDGTVVLLDCGNGVFGKLRRFVDYVAVDSVVISHLHADHFLDLVPFAYGLIYAPRQQPVPVDRWPGTDTPARPTLHAPQGAKEVFRRVTGAWGPEDLIEKAFDVREYEPGDCLELGSMRVRFHEVPHFMPHTNAVEFASTNGGGRFVYGADHRPTEELVQFAATSTCSSSRRRSRVPSATACAATSRRPRRASTPAGQRAGRPCSSTSPTRWTACGRRGAPARPSGRPIKVAAEGDVFEV